MEINEKNLKEILTEQTEGFQVHVDEKLKEQREEYQRYLGVVAENFESQVKLVAESVTGIQEQLIALRKMVARNTEDIIKIQVHLSAIREMVAKNTEDIEIIKMDTHIIKSDLKEKVGRDEFKTLENRVLALEKRAR
ncbi:MAG: hypothetical protein Q8L57_02405 [bacterium]|nr:hypothetical protein [bacterium]